MSDLFNVLNQAKQDIKDSFIGTCEALNEGAKQFQQRHTVSDSKLANDYSVHTEKEEVHDSLFVRDEIHSNPKALIATLNAINKICTNYLPVSCKWDWQDITKNIQMPKLAFYLTAPYKLQLKLEIDSVVYFTNPNLTGIESAILKILAKEIVSQVGYLQEQEAHNDNFIKLHNIQTNDQLRKLHYDEDSLIKIAQLFSLVEQYPQARENLKGALNEKIEMATISQLEEQEVIAYYNSCLKHYGLAKFYPSHVTYFDEHGLNRILFIQLRFAKKGGLINFTVNLFEKQIINGKGNEAMLKKLKSEIDNFDMKAKLNEIKVQKPAIYDKEKYLTILNTEMAYFKQISEEIKAQLM